MNEIYIHGDVNRQNLTNSTQNFENVDQPVISSSPTETNLSLKENELNLFSKQTSKTIINNEICDNDLKQNVNRITNDLTNFNNYVSENELQNKTFDGETPAENNGHGEFEKKTLGNNISQKHEAHISIDKFFEKICLERDMCYQGKCGLLLSNFCLKTQKTFF